MKIKYIFTATGKYSKFIEGLVTSGQKNFFPHDDTEFIVFTDSDIKSDKKLRVERIEKMGWPFDTLKRFHLINSISNTLDCDYIFYGNANMFFNNEVGREILPMDSSTMVGAIHPCFYNKCKSTFPYQRMENSTAYIPQGGEGINYYQGCFFGGKKNEFLQMSQQLQKSIDTDLKNGIIAEWHDEAHLNYYFVNNPPMAINSSYIYPESMQLPFDKNIIQLDKTKHGDHEFLRN